VKSSSKTKQPGEMGNELRHREKMIGDIGKKVELTEECARIIFGKSLEV